jgi:hypothetical protein
LCNGYIVHRNWLYQCDSLRLDETPPRLLI